HRRGRVLLRFGLSQHLRVDGKDSLRLAQLVDVNAPGIKGVLDPCRRLGAIAAGSRIKCKNRICGSALNK
ncbi:MAG: hypothetical protein ACE5I1_32550, partial [bacterium]